MAGRALSRRKLGNSDNAKGLLAYAVFAAVTIAAFAVIQLEVPAPYMDEPFHIPQAQQYCRGDFWTWDPKLTTPPGLYFLSLLPITLLGLPCSIPVLRATNLALLLALPWLISGLLRSIRPSSSRRASSLTEGARIAFFPPLWFFGHLYYTDIGSVVFILASWLASRRGHHLGASSLGLLSLTFRQTNVIWLAFIAGAAVLEQCAKIAEIGKTVVAGKDHLRREQRLAADYDSLASFVSTVLELPWVMLANLPTVIPIIAAYTPTFFAFFSFVLWNGGIVLGHQEYHGVSFHLPQTAYFFAFATAIGGPALLDIGLRRSFARLAKDAFGGPRAVLRTGSLLCVTLLAVKHFTIAHPFLLADNRHYAFYFWRRIINYRPLARYALAPGYVGCFILWAGRLLRTQPPLLLLLFLFCTIATLTPTPLIEPRYFLTPFVVIRVLAAATPPSMPAKSAKGVTSSAISVNLAAYAPALEAGWYAAINGAVLGVFLTIKFRWPAEEGWMRFMW